MSSYRNIAVTYVPLLCGVLLMIMTGPPTHATDEPSPDGPATFLLTDFSSLTPELGWYVQNDNVMGGRSEGGFNIIEEDQQLLFTGSTNTNGGGFSSIRTQPFKLDLAEYDGIQLRLKADGRRYTWQIQTSARYRRFRVSYWAEFDTVADEWITVNIPFKMFYPQIRGFPLDGPLLDPGDTREFGLYIYDKKDGAFKLELDSISAYAAANP
ncbi:MAG: CIA30 family protein [Gammaproteobacteria bacterium]